MWPGADTYKHILTLLDFGVRALEGNLANGTGSPKFNPHPPSSFPEETMPLFYRIIYQKELF